jgi:hypothetical protein
MYIDSPEYSHSLIFGARILVLIVLGLINVLVFVGIVFFTAILVIAIFFV